MADMKRIGPGIYDDNAGGLHIDLRELLAAYGYADTPENRDTLIEAARAAFPATTVIGEAYVEDLIADGRTPLKLIDEDR